MKHSANVRRHIVIACALMAMAFIAACSSWEKTVFQTLNADNAVIRQGIANYNARTARTVAEHDLLMNAKNVHNLATQSFRSYWAVKSAVQQTLANCKANAGATPAECVTAQAQLNAAIAGVNQALEQLPAVIAAVKAVKTNPPTGPGTQLVISQ